MLKFGFPLTKDRPLKMLCLGAHSDDIEIGCGGTILRLLSEHEEVEVLWVVFGSSGQRDNEASASAQQFLAGAGKREIVVENFRDGYFPTLGGEIKDYFEGLKKRFTPDVVFTHYRKDLHQDHRQISDLTWNTFRDHLILEYEIMKYDGDLGQPNFFVPLEQATCAKKVALLLEHFKSQLAHRWFREDTFLSLLRLRGVECNAPGDHAEGFYCRKLVI